MDDVLYFDADGTPIDLEEIQTGLVKNLREQVKDAHRDRDTAKAEAAEAAKRARRLDFQEAGIPYTKRNAYFIDSYDGDMTDEAIKAKAIEDGFLEAPADDAPSAEELAEHQQIANVTSGATAPGAADSETEKQAALAALGPKANARDVAEVLARFDPNSVTDG